jgi:hypothetical protein
LGSPPTESTFRETIGIPHGPGIDLQLLEENERLDPHIFAALYIIRYNVMSLATRNYISYIAEGSASNTANISGRKEGKDKDREGRKKKEMK